MTTIKKFSALCPRDQITLLDPGATFATVVDFRGRRREVVTVSVAAKAIDMPVIRRIARHEHLLVYTSLTAVRTPRPATLSGAETGRISH